MNSVDRYRSQRYSVRREKRERVGGIIEGRRSFRQVEMIIPSVKTEKKTQRPSTRAELENEVLSC